MKKIFYLGLIGLTLFEIMKVYFIMPMPGSQQAETIDIAYFLHVYRWYFRGVFVVFIILGISSALQVKKPWLPVVSVLPVLIIIYFFNFRMTAEKMFVEPEALIFKSRNENLLNDSTIVLAISYKGEAKAYPLRYIVYHHQVRDTIAGKPVMVTYCSVCRTGRVFEPAVKGKEEVFRLVGMDHFNAMFEDASTKSWWRQTTGEAVTGPLKGMTLPEVESVQLTANKFFSIYPFGLMMQADDASKSNYDTLGKFEWGKNISKLTGRDSASWNEKSWVVGIQEGEKTKAYDWNLLQQKKIIHDHIKNVPIVLVLSADNQSFIVFGRNSMDEMFQLRNDTLFTENQRYDFSGKNLSDGNDLRRIKAYQEFWHSWRTFHPDTEKY